jgi:hypothetical protein
VTIGPDGTAYLGVLGGVVRLADATPPNVPAAPESGPLPASRPATAVRVRVGCARGGRTVVRATGAGVRALRVRRGSARAVTDGRRPLAVRVRRDRHRLRVQVTMQDGRILSFARRAPRCPPRSGTR